MDRYVYFSSDDGKTGTVTVQPPNKSKLTGGKEILPPLSSPADFTVSDFEFKHDFQNCDPWEVSLSEFITEDLSSDSTWGFLCVDGVIESTLVGNRYVPGLLRRVQLKSSLKTTFHPEIFMSVVKLPTRHSSYRFTLLGENRQPVTVKSGRILFTLHFRRTEVRRDASAYTHRDIMDF